ncbi:MAG TPA: glycosyltransferase, partial [Dongiaceae bacterium]|nr:glycosyltransferase [Dongiaceae bacterium]
DTRAKLGHVATLLGHPGILPDAAQRAAIAVVLRDLQRHSERTLFQRVFPPAERAALLDLEFALHLATACPWYSRARPPILDAPETAEPLTVVDARCLQHFAYRSRGVGLHTRSVLTVLRDLAPPGAKIVLLLDPTLPAVDDAVAGQCDGQVYSCAAIDLARVVLFISASPMTASIGPITPLLLAAHVRRVAIQYDFIPARFPLQYLRAAADVIGYQARIMSLPAYHAFLPISTATATDLRDRLGFAESALVAHTGVANPLQSVSDDAAASPDGHGFIAVPTGDESRKNLLVAIAAEALNRSLGEAANRIVVVGLLAPKSIKAVRRFCRRIGFPMSDLVLRSEVPACDLAAVYRHASVSIVPSFAEGFSIPLAESLHAGTAVVASDIPAHRDLLGAGPWLAAPSSVADMARALRTTLKNREVVLRHQRQCLGDKAWPDAVRARTASLLAQLLAMPADAAAPAIPRATGGQRPRIAIATPWPPQRSGIASYSRYTAGRLADLADVTILTNAPPDQFEPSADGRVVLREIGASAYLDPQYDRVLTVLGNSHFHLPALEYLMALGGPVLAHDNRMIEFYRFLFGPGELARLLTIPEWTAVQIPDIAPLLHNPDQLPALGYADIGRVAHPLLVHSASLQGRLARETQACVLVLPFVPYRAPPIGMSGDDRRMARQRRGLDEPDLHVATFGMLDRRTKGANVLFEAMAWLDLWRVPARLHVVGEMLAGDRAWIEETARANGIRDRFEFHDYLDEAGYRDMLLAVDIAVQLRVGSVLTLSGALLDCMAFGVPTIATRSMAADMHVPDFVIPTPDKLSPLLIAEAIVAHSHDRSTSLHEIETQRLAYLAHHSAERYARLMAAALGLNERGVP